MQFTYNATTAKKWGITKDDWIACLCNCNRVTHEDIAQDEFEKIVTFDSVNNDAFPVLVYMQNSVPVAFYDEENEWGYVA